MSETDSAKPRSLDRLLAELDRLVELLEDMDDLGVNSRAEIEARMRNLDAQIDELAIA